MSDPNSAPVSLAAGSFDYDTLKDGLNKAAKGAAKNYDTAVGTALTDAGDHAFAEPDHRTMPGYEFRKVENEELGVTETINVFNPKLADKVDTSNDIPDVPPVSPANLAAAKEAAAADSKE